MRSAPSSRWLRAAAPMLLLVALAGCTSAGAPAYGAPAVATGTPAPAAPATDAAPAVTPASTTAAVPATAAASPVRPFASPAGGGSGGTGYGDGYSGGGSGGTGYGYGGGDGYGGYGGGQGAGTTTAPGASSAAAGTAATLATAVIPGVGTVLAGPGGLTLYTYKPDAAGVSACTGGCAAAWPPFIATALPASPRGVSGTISLVARADGSRQVAYGGHPLYTYSGDTGPGEAIGQGLGGVWFVAEP